CGIHSQDVQLCLRRELQIRRAATSGVEINRGSAQSIWRAIRPRHSYSWRYTNLRFPLRSSGLSDRSQRDSGAIIRATAGPRHSLSRRAPPQAASDALDGGKFIEDRRATAATARLFHPHLSRFTARADERNAAARRAIVV